MRLNLRRLLAPVLSVVGIAFSASSVLSQELPPKTATLGAPMYVENNNARGDTGGFVGGIGMYVVKPYFDSQRAFTRTTFAPAPAGIQITNTDFDYSTSVSPRLWLGYVNNCGWGVRASGWFFDQTSSQATSLSPADVAAGTTISSASPAGFPLSTGPNGGTANLGIGTEFLNVRSRLRVDIGDFEITKAFDVGRSMILVSAGARVAYIANDYRASLSNDANDPAVLFNTIVLNNTQRFTGAGPTVSLQGHCPIGNGGFAMYGMGRAAFVAGQYRSETNIVNTTIIANGVPVVNTPVASISSHNLIVPMGEVELGGEWNATQGRIRPLFRVGVVAHSYQNVFNNNVGGVPNTTGVNSSLSFLGFTVATGIRY